MRKPTLSLCMIVKNEEKTLPFALKNLKQLVDEIIVVDTGSTDRTVETARNLGAQVYHFKWTDDFSAARNESLKHAAQDWILVMDADEFIQKQDVPKIKNLLKDGKITAYFCPLYAIRKEERELKPEELHPSIVYFSNRLFRNHRGIRYKNRIHESNRESIDKIKGIIKRSPVPLYHYGFTADSSQRERNFRNLEIALEEVKEAPEASGSLLDLGRAFSGLGRYEEAILIFKRAIKACCKELVLEDKYARKGRSLLEMQLRLVEAYISKGDYQAGMIEAVKIIKSMVNLKDRRPFMALGKCLLDLKHYKEAEKVFKALQATKPANILEVPSVTYPLDIPETATFNLAMIYEAVGKYSEACRELQKLVSKKYNLLKVTLLLILCYYKGGEYKKVVDSFARWRKFLEGQVRSNQALSGIYVYVGASCYYLGQYQKGIEMLEKALVLSPASADAHLYLGHIYFRKKNKKLTAEHYSRAMEFSPAYNRVLFPLIKKL